MPPSTAPPPAATGMQGKIGQMQSLFNPADLAAMFQRGEITPQTKFGDLLAKMGISPDDTLMEVVQKTTREVVKGNPIQKMKALAQPGPEAPPESPPGMPPGGGGAPPPPVAPSGPGTMDELFGVR